MIEDDLIARISQLEARVKELEADKAHLVMMNAMLRQRPDLPVDRIPVYNQVTSRIRELDAAASVAQRMQREPTVDHPSYE